MLPILYEAAGPHPVDNADTSFETQAPPGAEPRLARISRPAILFFQRHAIWIVTLAAALTRFIRLSSPHAIIPLDETYYAKDAAAYLRHGVEEGFAVHPPVGKWMIAFGEWIFGNRPFGWRFSAAVVGTLSIVLIYLIAKRLWNSRFAAVTAAIFLASDGLFFVQSRIAMLDIFLAFWILVGFWMLLEDRARAAVAHRWPRWWRIGAGVAFGLAASAKWSGAFVLPMVLAVAITFEIQRLLPSRVWQARLLAVLACPPLVVTGVFLVHDIVYRASVAVAFVIAVAVWLVAEFRTMQSSEEPAADTVPTLEPEEHDPIEYTGDATAAAQDDPVFPGPATRQVVGIVLTFTLIPMLIYLASYTPWFLSTKRYVPPRCNNTVTDAGGLQRTKPKAGFSLWLCYQNEIKDYHKNLKATKEDGTPIHPYLSHAWSWPWIGRPAAHYFHAETRQVNVRTCSNITGTSVCTNNVKPVTYDSEVLGAPNPVVWWPAFFIAIPLLLWWAIRRDAIAALILAMFAPLYVPWLITTRPLFMFYMTPAAPFLVLALTHVLHRTVKRWPSSIAVVSAFPAMAVLGFVYFYPVLAAYPVTEPVWRSRMLFGGGSKLSFAGDCTSRFMKIRCWI